MSDPNVVAILGGKSPTITHMKQIGRISVTLAICAALGRAQTIGSTLQVEFVNAAAYFGGYCAVADIGKNPAKLTRPTPIPPFVTGVGVADIISVNGIPVKGVAIESFNGALLSPTMVSGKSIADFTATPTNAAFELTFLNLDGTVIGTLEIHGQGNSADVRPPGAPSAFPGGSLYSVTAGTGPFLGVRGYFAPVQDTVSRSARRRTAKTPRTAGSMQTLAATSAIPYSF